MAQDGPSRGRALPVPARAPHKIARSASDRANLCKMRNMDKSARRMGYERRCGGSYIYVIPSGVEESRCVTIAISTGSFDFAQDDGAIAGVVIRTVNHKIR